MTMTNGSRVCIRLAKRVAEFEFRSRDVHRPADANGHAALRIAVTRERRAVCIGNGSCKRETPALDALGLASRSKVRDLEIDRVVRRLGHGDSYRSVRVSA